jgi:hypothetical protein
MEHLPCPGILGSLEYFRSLCKPGNGPDGCGRYGARASSHDPAVLQSAYFHPHQRFVLHGELPSVDVETILIFRESNREVRFAGLAHELAFSRSGHAPTDRLRHKPLQSSSLRSSW